MDFWKMPSVRIPYSILLGSTVDACYVSLLSRKLRFLRSCSSFLVVDIPFVLQWQISMVQTIQQIIGIPLSLFVFGGRCPRYAGRAVSQVLPWRRHSCSHSCSSWRSCRPWFRLLKTAGFPQLQFVKVVHFPVVVQRPIFMVFCSEDHSCSPVAPQHGDRCPCCTGRADPLYLAVSCTVFGVRLWSFRLQEIFTYSALSDSTVDTRRRQSTRLLEDFHTFFT